MKSLTHETTPLTHAQALGQFVQGKGQPDLSRSAMNTQRINFAAFQETLGGKEAELVQMLRGRENIAIEKSADQMDEIQFASERDLAIRNVDRESKLLRQVRGAMVRIRDGSFGTCMDCDEAISPKRLAAVPWASCCIRCQEIADQDQQAITHSINEDLVDAA